MSTQTATDQEHTMTAPTKLEPGMIIQYRKVGTARLVRCEYEYNAETGSGRWELEWIKAPKKYREEMTSGFWITPADIIATA
jgi:hypothetical protein